MGRTRLHQSVVDLCRPGDGHVQLPPQLPYEGHAQGQHGNTDDRDLLAGHEPEGRVADITVGQRFEDITGVRAHQTQDGPGFGLVLDGQP